MTWGYNVIVEIGEVVLNWPSAGGGTTLFDEREFDDRTSKAIRAKTADRRRSDRHSPLAARLGRSRRIPAARGGQRQPGGGAGAEREARSDHHGHHDAGEGRSDGHQGDPRRRPNR